MTWNRSKQETLALPINTLALLILEDYQAGEGWNWQNWMRGSEQHGTARDREISAALAEGWGWLMPIPSTRRSRPRTRTAAKTRLEATWRAGSSPTPSAHEVPGEPLALGKTTAQSTSKGYR